MLDEFGNPAWLTDPDDILDEIEFEEEEDSFFEWLNEGVDDIEDNIDIGTCACGAYGYRGKIHTAMFDGQMEECGEYL